MSWSRNYSGWPPYVPVYKKKERAAKKVASLRKKGHDITPITIEGRALTKTFWGKAWCENLESYGDYANRIPRGRSYVRHGCVVDLKMDKGEINALVHGSSLYEVHISIDAIEEETWQSILQACVGKIESMIELLQGRFSQAVMEVMTHQDTGLFPDPEEIRFTCSCYDHADLCKHVAAALYGVGVRLDKEPMMLFMLREVDPMALITSINSLDPLMSLQDQEGVDTLEETNLSALFGIEIEGESINLVTSKEVPSQKRKTKIRKDVIHKKRERESRKNEAHS